MGGDAWAKTRFWQFSINAYINCLNKSFIGIVARVIKKLDRAEIGKFRANKAYTNMLKADVTPKLPDRGVKFIFLEK